MKPTHKNRATIVLHSRGPPIAKQLESATVYVELLKGASKNNMRMYTTSNTIQNWSDIDFQKAEKSVKKLQKRIATAYRNDEFDKMAFLQHQLIHSFYAKALAVKSVTSNRGKLTPGVDGIVWITPDDKWNAIAMMKHRGYQPKPLKRIYIPKANGKLRPLSIPTMKDRAMQTLYKFALEPIGELTADGCSFAYLPNRSAKDAIVRMRDVLSKNPDFQWIMKADIKACFDNISHEWILEHIPMDKTVLRKFLECGYVEHSMYHLTDKGVPQGGCISCVICNMTLDGLERLLEEHFGPLVKMIRYADDIIIAGVSKPVLVQEVTPVLENFLIERGLTLSKEKTDYLSVEQHIHFLGWEIYKDNAGFLCIPPREKIDTLLGNLSDTWDEYCHDSGQKLCEKLYQQIRGWLNYYAGVAPLQALNGIEFETVMLLNSLTGDNWLAGFIGNIFSKCLKDMY